LFFYRGKPLNENINFRKALFHGINRDRFSTDIPHNKSAYEMMVRPYGGRIHTPNPYNPKLAAEYAAKIPKSLLSKPVKVGIFSTEKSFSAIGQKRIELITEDLKAIGIPIVFELNFEKFPSPEVIEKFDIKQMAKVVDLADPAISFGAMASISPYAKEIPDTSGEYDRRYAEALNAQTFDSRIEAIEKIAKLIEDQALLVPLIQQYVTHRYNPATIESLGAQAQPMFLNLGNVVMKKATLATTSDSATKKQDTAASSKGTAGTKASF
jgi:ABC-type transport system substrate-binding protein